MADTLDFLLEIGTEEMPSAPLINASKQLPKLVVKMLDEAGLAHGDVRVVSSPRRLAAIVSDVACATEAVHEVKRGPKAQIAFDADGNPTKAAAGFARKCGIDASELTRKVDEDGNEYVFAERNVPSEPAMPILSALGHDVIAAIEWPNYRSQRWGSEHETFVRPIRWICSLLGSEVVPVTYADVTSGNTTRGHRVLAPGEHAVAEPAAYERVLKDSYVLGAEAREAAIREGIAAIEAERPGSHVDTPARIFDEVVNLCEWPTVLVGTFDEEFLRVPQEIICESMLSNQRYFPIFDAEGKLTREFVIVSNADPKVSDTVVSGNERVVRPRLDDAKFFFDEDLKRPMEEFVERLGIVTFQEKLGTTLQKVQRMEKLAGAAAAAAGEDVAGVANIGLPMIVVCIPAFLALMFVLTIKLRKSPFDLSYSHHAHQELVKGVTTEMSGRTLAKVEVMHWCETTLFLGWVAMFFIWDNPVSIVLAVVVAALAFFLEIFIDNNFARVKWQKCLKWAWIVALVCGLANTAWLVFALIA